jgi:hypothetical protein
MYSHYRLLGVSNNLGGETFLGACLPVDSVASELGLVAVVRLKLFVGARVALVLDAHLSPCVPKHVLGCFGLSTVVTASGASSHELEPVRLSAFHVSGETLVLGFSLGSAFSRSHSFTHDFTLSLTSANHNLQKRF